MAYQLLELPLMRLLKIVKRKKGYLSGNMKMQVLWESGIESVELL